MKKTLNPSNYGGILKAPSSKSYMQRAIAIALLAEGKTNLSNCDKSKDSMAILKMAGQLGAEIETFGDQIQITGNRNFKGPSLSAGESGLGIRTFTPIASLYHQKIELIGEGSLLKRPMNMLEEPLKNLGVEIQSKNGFLPLLVKGPLKGGFSKVDGSISSQVLTGLLIALPLAQQDSVLIVDQLQSIPYIDMTLDIMKKFGIKVQHDQYETFHINGNQKYKSQEYDIEGDWSGASFHLVAAAISGELELLGIQTDSLQADKAILDALKKAGATVHTQKESIMVKKGPLKGFEFDATHCPDLFPPLAVLAAASKGISTIKGVNRLLYKESNRALVLQNELGKLGVDIKIEDDLMIIHGGKIKGGEIDSNHDHRIAMAGAICSLLTEEPIVISNAESIQKSYPDFYRDFDGLCSSKESIV